MDLVKREQDEDQQAFLPEAREDISFSEKGSRRATSASKMHLRLILEIVMAFVVVVLLIHPFRDRKTVKPSPVPRCMFLTCDLKTKEDIAVANMKLRKFH
jgi:hypothetical protein